ncbi:MAG: FAD:protein FMN transferase, partial [Thermoguttaceae bacterium]
DSGKALDNGELKNWVQTALDGVDSAMSTYRADSEVSRFNASDSTDWFPVSEETASVIKLALEISEMTQGTFDITVAPLVNRWGFGPQKRTKPPTQEEIDELLKSVGYEHLQVRMNPPAIKKDSPGVQIDLSGIAKGYAVDAIAEALENHGFQDYLIEVGGETRCKGHKTPEKQWLIGIEIPLPNIFGEPQIDLLAHLGNNSMATSGDYHNFIEDKGIRYSHIIDPRTGWPTEKNDVKNTTESIRVGSTSVIDPSCAKADALAKGFYILGIEEGLKFANDNDIAVLYIVRTESEDGRSNEKISIKEIMSDKFKKEIKSWKPN